LVIVDLRTPHERTRQSAINNRARPRRRSQRAIDCEADGTLPSRTDRRGARDTSRVADRDLHPQLRVAIDIIIGAFESRWEDVIGHIRALSGSGFSDPEGFFHWSGALALAGDREGAPECSRGPSRSASIPRRLSPPTPTSIHCARCQTFTTSSGERRSDNATRVKHSAPRTVPGCSGFHVCNGSPV